MISFWENEAWNGAVTFLTTRLSIDHFHLCSEVDISLRSGLQNKTLDTYSPYIKQNCNVRTPFWFYTLLRVSLVITPRSGQAWFHPAAKLYLRSCLRKQLEK